MSIYVGLDIGGTKFMVAAADESLRIIRRVREETPPGLDDGIRVLHAMIAEVAGGERILGMGSAIGGPLDWRTGVVSPLHQPTWRNVPLKAIMQEKWGCPFWVDVDTNVAAFGEYRLGGERFSSLLYVTVSTGVGGGLVKDGKLFRGAGAAHPEVGHQAIAYRCCHPEKITCECGAPDSCLEALVCGNAIRRIYGKPAEELSDQQWEEVGYNFGQGLRNMAALLTPEVIVAGGGMCIGAGEKLLAPARRVMTQALKIVPVPRLKLSALGYDAPLMGALAAAKHGLE